MSESIDFVSIPPMTNYSQEQLAIWRLTRTKGIGPVAFQRLMNICGSAQAAIEQLPELSRAKKRSTEAVPLSDIEQEVETLTKHGGIALFLNEPNYPYLLQHIPDPPPVLQILGNPQHLTPQTLAIVGSRNASAAGINFTQKLGRELVQNGYTLISGLARGIDTTAHQACLQENKPTIAVVAAGVDHLYPPENAKLRQQIIEHGCIVAEQPIGSTPTARHFPRRNRIITGLSRAVIITEASRRSGSLITATYAGEYGREVFAVPGSPADTRAAGTNHLLKQGATLLESAEDVFNVLDAYRPFTPQPVVSYTGEEAGQPHLFMTEQEETETSSSGILSLLSTTPVPLDILIRQSNKPETEVIIELTELELDGKLKRHPNGDISLT